MAKLNFSANFAKIDETTWKLTSPGPRATTANALVKEVTNETPAYRSNREGSAQTAVPT